MAKSKNDIKVRTFKDDVLALVHNGKNGDSFTYYAVIKSEIDNIYIEKRRIILSKCNLEKFLTVKCICTAMLSGIRYEEKIKDICDIHNSKDRRLFMHRHLLNALTIKNKKDNSYIPVTRKDILSFGGLVYFAETPGLKENLRKKVRNYLNAIKTIYEPITYVRDILHKWIFYSIFFNSYSNIELLDVFAYQVKESIDNKLVAIKNMNISSMDEIKNYLSHANMSVKLKSVTI